jgi:dTDP-4-dehydrorhamnose 3,5-epimerase
VSFEPSIIKGSVHTDARGFFTEVLKDFGFRQINMSWSKKGTVRGIHAQRQMSKAMWLSSGKATIFAVNLDPASALFGKTIAEEMVAGDGKVFYAPWWWGRGFIAHEDTSVVYATTDVYRPEHEIAVRYTSIPEVEAVVKATSLNLIVSEKDLAARIFGIGDTITALQEWKRVGDEIAFDEE